MAQVLAHLTALNKNQRASQYKDRKRAIRSLAARLTGGEAVADGVDVFAHREAYLEGDATGEGAGPTPAGQPAHGEEEESAGSTPPSSPARSSASRSGRADAPPEMMSAERAQELMEKVAERVAEKTAAAAVRRILASPAGLGRRSSRRSAGPTPPTSHEQRYASDLAGSTTDCESISSSSSDSDASSRSRRRRRRPRHRRRRRSTRGSAGTAASVVSVSTRGGATSDAATGGSLRRRTRMRRPPQGRETLRGEDNPDGVSRNPASAIARLRGRGERPRHVANLIYNLARARGVRGAAPVLRKTQRLQLLEAFRPSALDGLATLGAVAHAVLPAVSERNLLAALRQADRSMAIPEAERLDRAMEALAEDLADLAAGEDDDPWRRLLEAGRWIGLDARRLTPTLAAAGAGDGFGVAAGGGIRRVRLPHIVDAVAATRGKTADLRTRAATHGVHLMGIISGKEVVPGDTLRILGITEGTLRAWRREYQARI